MLVFARSVILTEVNFTFTEVKMHGIRLTTTLLMVNRSFIRFVFLNVVVMTYM